MIFRIHFKYIIQLNMSQLKKSIKIKGKGIIMNALHKFFKKSIALQKINISLIGMIKFLYTQNLIWILMKQYILQVHIFAKISHKINVIYI